MALSATATEFRATLGALGLTPRHAAKLFAVAPRAIRRWQDGTRSVPRAVTLVCRLMAVGAVTIAQVEQAAVPSPIQTSGGAEPTPAGTRHAHVARRRLARAKTTTLADPGQTTAEKLCALPPRTCHWPCGDPRDRDFHFCCDPTLEPPYCPRHRAAAYLAPRPGRGRGHVGFVVHGRHGRPPIPSAVSTADAAQAPTTRAAFPAAYPHPLEHEASPC